MAFLRKKNCARTTINQIGGLDASALSLIVADASELPNSGDFLITIWDKVVYPCPCDDPNNEIVKVTDVSGNTLTIIRGQEDTIGAVHANGQAVEMLITAGTFEEIENAISASSNIPIIGEDLTSQIDGIKDTFTISSSYLANTTTVYLGGQRLRRGFGYTEETDTTIKILGDLVVVGQIIVIDYYTA